MDFFVNTFHPICIFQLQDHKLINTKSKPIEISMKIAVMNEGSHTRLIQYLTNQKIKIQLLQQNEKKLTKIQRRIRYVWLETSAYTNITFARSLWKIQYRELNTNQIKRNLPIGQSFIDSKIDINKEINELYYCYCKALEKELRSKQAVWGRKYKLHYEKHSSILIQEFFSKELCFFKLKLK
uniref:hypothetical protein n=1 Tax=Symphyocladia marchantioides TaxID=88360 RepID=UPI0022FD530D|nr:hypothetical protein PNW48_pgp150 [Symphyocladia marchantioides]WAX03821.1 hypothetical protein [Symphyocladia marchantioides]